MDIKQQFTRIQLNVDRTSLILSYSVRRRLISCYIPRRYGMLLRHRLPFGASSASATLNYLPVLLYYVALYHLTPATAFQYY